MIFAETFIERPFKFGQVLSRIIESGKFFGDWVFGQEGFDCCFLLGDNSASFAFFGREVGYFPIFYLQFSEEAQVKQQFFGIFRDDLLDFFEDIVEDNFAGLLLHFCQFGNSTDVEFDGGVGEVDFIFHFHAVFDQKFLEDADDGFFGVVFGDELGGELNWIRRGVRKSEARMMRSCSSWERHHLEKEFHTFE